ncbi:hypothetical protein [Microbulbifer sp. TRSA007]|uniref:hypothetical protein n=1 Tax=Microbulbifer sp. TRSA007 TaxID=3243384 RepID=UPI0040392D53
MDFILNNLEKGILINPNDVLFLVILLLVGLLLLYIGLVIFSISVYQRTLGAKYNAIVAGGVSEIWETARGTKSNLLFAVFKYQDENGIERYRKSVSGGDHNLKYKTGEKTVIVTFEALGYTIVYDTKKYSELKISFCFVVAGATLTSVSIGFIFALALGFIPLLLGVAYALYKWSKRDKPKNRKFTDSDIDLDRIRSIESFKSDLTSGYE